MSLAFHDSLFRHSQQWSLHPWRDFVCLTAGGRLFGFQPTELFTKYGRGRRPKELTATIRAAEYLSGARRAPITEDVPAEPF